MLFRTLPLIALLAGCTDKSAESTETGHEDTGHEHTGDTDTGEETGETDTSEEAPDGATLYATHCQACHGADGRGTASGPDIVHELHHTDAEIIAVMLNGKGEMAPVAITQAEAEAIMAYMRLNFE